MDTNVDYEYLKNITKSTDQKVILKELMTDYGNDVWNYAFSLTRKWEQADDITQEVFLKVYRNLFSFRNESSMKTWLLTITRNAVRDYKKSAFLRKVTLVDFMTYQETHSSAEHEAVEKLAVNEIWQQVLQLPVKYREILILYGHYQLTMKEIAQILKIREGTVKSRLHHARMKIIKLKDSETHG